VVHPDLGSGGRRNPQGFESPGPPLSEPSLGFGRGRRRTWKLPHWSSASSLIGVVVLRVLGYRIEKARREEEVRESREADVTARWESEIDEKGRSQWRFILHNIGSATAREDTFEIVAVGEGNVLHLHTADKHLPIPMLDINQPYRFVVAMMMGVANAVDVHLRWKDELGERTKTVRVSTF
jgi:hypothetical protein